MLGSSKAVNAACLAVFDPSTNSALSRQLGSAKKKLDWGVFRLARLTSCAGLTQFSVDEQVVRDQRQKKVKFIGLTQHSQVDRAG